MLAVAGGHVDAVSLLLEREANVNVASKHGLTALHLGVSINKLPLWRLECATRTISFNAHVHIWEYFLCSFGL